MSDELQSALQRCAARIARAETILLATHEQPDGDAIGSTLGLAQALRERGKCVLVHLPEEMPPRYRFLIGAERVVRSVAADARFDLAIACDCGTADRLGEALSGFEQCAASLNLDHHAYGEPFGDENAVDPQAAATGVVVFQLLRAMDHALTPGVAEALWVALVSDTGGFRYPCTNAECMEIASALVAAGAMPGKVSEQLFEREPHGRIRLLASALSTLTRSPSGAVAWISIDGSACAREGLPEDTPDGFIGFPRSIDGVQVALSFRDLGTGHIRVSMRSRGAIDVGALALAWGGGGHRNASGFTAESSLEALVARLVPQLERLAAAVPAEPAPGHHALM